MGPNIVPPHWIEAEWTDTCKAPIPMLGLSEWLGQGQLLLSAPSARQPTWKGSLITCKFRTCFEGFIKKGRPNSCSLMSFSCVCFPGPSRWKQASKGQFKLVAHPQLPFWSQILGKSMPRCSPQKDEGGLSRWFLRSFQALKFWFHTRCTGKWLGEQKWPSLEAPSLPPVPPWLSSSSIPGTKVLLGLQPRSCSCRAAAPPSSTPPLALSPGAWPSALLANRTPQPCPSVRMLSDPHSTTSPACPSLRDVCLPALTFLLFSNVDENLFFKHTEKLNGTMDTCASSSRKSRRLLPFCYICSFSKRARACTHIHTCTCFPLNRLKVNFRFYDTSAWMNISSYITTVLSYLKT